MTNLLCKSFLLVSPPHSHSYGYKRVRHACGLLVVLLIWSLREAGEPLGSLNAYSSVYRCFSDKWKSCRSPNYWNSCPPSSPSHWPAQGVWNYSALGLQDAVKSAWRCRPACWALLCFQGLALYSYHLWDTEHLVKTNNSHSSSCPCSSVQQNCLLLENPSTCEWVTLPTVAKKTKISLFPMFLLKNLLLHSWDN